MNAPLVGLPGTEPCVWSRRPLPVPNLWHITLLKADRPHPRNYPQTHTDFRHTDNGPRLVLVVALCADRHSPICLFSTFERHTVSRCYLSLALVFRPVSTYTVLKWVVYIWLIVSWFTSSTFLLQGLHFCGSNPGSPVL